MLIGTRGLMTCTGFGQLLASAPAQPSMGVWARSEGSSSSSAMRMIRYNFGNDAVTLGTQFTPVTPLAGSAAAAGNATTGIYALGATTISATPTPYTYAYTFAASTMVGGSNLADNLRYGAAMGTDSTGYFAHGQNTGATAGSRNISKYTYSSGAVVGAPNLLIANSVQNAATAGGSGYGVFSTGSLIFNGPGQMTNNRYTYSTDAIVAGTSFDIIMTRTSAFGNADMGIFVSATAGQPTRKYTYSSGSVAASGNLTMSSSQVGGCSAGNDTIAITCSAAQSSSRKFTYATEVSSAATAIYSGGASGFGPPWAACSNGINGVTAL